MNLVRLNQLMTQLNHIVPQHERITATVKDPRGYLTADGAKHAKKCLGHATFTLDNIKAAIAAELGA